MDEVLAARFRDFEQHGTRAPRYAAMARRIAEDAEVLALLEQAPPEQRIPVLLFAAVHLLALEGRAPALAAHYPNLSGTPSDDDPYPAFRAAALEHADEVRHLVATRHTQTNEIGRCALWLPALAAVAAECGPLSLVDVGASGGLNLLLPQYRFDYGEGRVVGGASPVTLTCSLRGDPPTGIVVPQTMPPIAAAVGLDAKPIDVHDDDAVRWLEACVWPDMTDRFHRLVAAVELARQRPPSVVEGDAVRDAARLVDGARAHGHPVVLTSWVLNYLDVEQQRAFVAALDGCAHDDLTWIVSESPAETPGLPIPTTMPPEVLTVVSIVRWRAGRRAVQRLGTAHPHGYWLHWDTER